VKQLIKQNVSHLELVRDALKSRGWTAAELSRKSGVSTGVISRYLNEVLGINDDNLYSILCALDLIQDGKANGFMCGWDENAIEYCKALKEILDSGDKIARAAILSNIDAFKESVDRKKRIDVLEEDVRELKKSNAGLSSERRPKHIIKKKAM